MGMAGTSASASSIATGARSTTGGRATGALASIAGMIAPAGNYSPFAAMAFIRATSALAPPFWSTVPKSERRVAIWLIAFL